MAPTDDPRQPRVGAGARNVARPFPPASGTIGEAVEASAARADEAAETRPPLDSLVLRLQDDVSGLRVRGDGQSVGGSDVIIPPAKARDLPVDHLSGSPPATVRAMGNALLAVACEAANHAKFVMEQTTNEAARIASSKVLSDIAIKLYQLAYGQRVAVTTTIKSQEDLPAWDTLPSHVQEA